MAAGLEKDFESLLSMAIEVKHDNTDEFMKYFKGRVDGFASKYFDSAVRKLDMTEPEIAPSLPGSMEPSSLTSGLHGDGTIHIYIKEKDSGLSVGLREDGTLIVKVDESKRSMVAGSG